MIRKTTLADEPSKAPVKTTRKLRAFISVTDKSGLEKFKRFTDAGHEIVSTGGTAKRLAEHDIPCTLVEEVTDFPEILDGRVKSMHPLITGGMLGNTKNPKHVEQMHEHGIEPFDLVVVNFYDFAGNPSIENIDIGGPTALRSAAKNGDCAVPIIDPDDYNEVLDHLLETGNISRYLREYLANKVFTFTAKYDTAIAVWMERKRQAGERLFEQSSTSH